MRRLFLIVFVFFCICEKSFAQIDSALHEILINALTDPEIRGKALLKTDFDDSAAYIFLNDCFMKQIQDFHGFENRIYNDARGLIEILPSKDPKLYVFNSAIGVNSKTNFGVSKAIVFDKIKITNQTALIVFHTSSLDIKDWYKKQRAKDNFYKVTCYLSLGSVRYRIVSKKITVIKFNTLSGT
jgi:hypothetical protein